MVSKLNALLSAGLSFMILLAAFVDGATEEDKQKAIQQVAEELFRKGGQPAVDEFQAATNKQAVLMKYLGGPKDGTAVGGAQAFPWCALTLGFFCDSIHMDSGDSHATHDSDHGNRRSDGRRRDDSDQ